VRHAIVRFRRSRWPIVHASVAAAVSWWFAHRVLGHAQPFFAPIAAAIALSTSRIQRSRRIVQLVGGVLLGIAVGEVLAATLGTSTIALGVIVFVTFAASLISGAGFIGDGMMFSNQAAASAILVVTLHRHGTGSERAVDALVGGSVALVLGVLMFPAQPLALIGEAEQHLLTVLARTLAEIDRHLEGSERPPEQWALEAGRRVHNALEVLSRAVATARITVRVAPRRWGLRSTVEAEIERTRTFDLLTSAVLGLVRGTSVLAAEADPLPSPIHERVRSVADALERLSRAPRPWSDEVRAGLRDVVGALETQPLADPFGRAAALGIVLSAIGRDLERVITDGV
jgi:uncharacterized membrane protein YgaE (UPF0421/DUF939 family)